MHRDTYNVLIWCIFNTYLSYTNIKIPHIVGDVINLMADEVQKRRDKS